MTTRVLFLWMEDDAGGAQSKRWEWMPECPAEGTTVCVPLYPTDARGYTDPEHSRQMRVHNIVWTCDGTPFWHAEIDLR